MLKRTASMVALLLVSLSPFAGEEDSIDLAGYHHWASQLRGAGADLCQGTSGQAFEIRNLSAAPREGGVAVTYTLVRFESCEEGAAFYEVERAEIWNKAQGYWRKVTDVSKW